MRNNSKTSVKMSICYQCSGIGLLQAGTTMVPVNGAKVVAPGLPQTPCPSCGGTGIERSFGV